MNLLVRLARGTALACLALLVMGPVSAQVSAINSVVISTREFNDDPTSDLTVVNNYPSLISFDDQSVDKNGASGGFANRHVWRFSSDNGASAFKFTNNTFFNVSMDLKLTGGPISPRKEAGFLFDTSGGQGQFIVNTDAHEVVAFGGPLPFYAFPATFNSGDTIHLGMTYFQDTDGKRKIIYQDGSLFSPAQEFTNLEQGIIDNSTLGGYLQVDLLNTNPNNFGTAAFSAIHISAPTPVPGPSAILTLLMGSGLQGLGLARHYLRRPKPRQAA